MTKSYGLLKNRSSDCSLSLTFSMSRCRKKHATHAKTVSVANKSQCTNDMHVGSAGITEGALAGEGGG